jgi:RHH-type proline utilization regulon transcriptional repressor/proline dehydrogenase/delta 1-pyrroline-5-carboxylate dehydrogenase
MIRAWLEQAIARVRAAPEDDSLLASEAVALAAELLAASQRAELPAEHRQASRLARMMLDPAGKAFTVELADQVLRPQTPARAAEQFRYLLAKRGIPAYLPVTEQLALRAGALVSVALPGMVIPALTAQMRAQSAAVILPAEAERLRPLLAIRRAAGMRMNLNQLGEAILGEEEAQRRLQLILARLASPDCDYLSVKLSSIFSQIHLVGAEESLAEITRRLRSIYRAAIQHRVDGRPKFVNLDMEKYRDLGLTTEAFKQVLAEEEFLGLEAGIVLQAYLPDAWPMQRHLSAWARRRVGRGGAGIKIRIVKGANLAMERVEAELHGWPQAPYLTKLEADANFKRMLHEGCRPRNAAAVRIGVASHNLFDIAYGLLLRSREGVGKRVEFEMLEGMANPEARAVGGAAGGMLLYVPVVAREDFASALAYLVRRLDENTAAGNFLCDGFGMRPGDAGWERQKGHFLLACQQKDKVFAGPRRSQSRAQEAGGLRAGGVGGFGNVADTDWSLGGNVAWIRARVEAALGQPVEWISAVVGGVEQAGAGEASSGDPSRPGKVVYRHALAGPAEVEAALQAAQGAQAEWRGLAPAARSRLLRDAGVEFARARGEAIAAMVVDAGKAVAEADVEVSEAIDFANYYAEACELTGDGAEFAPFGTVLVTPPWNFPFAIPAGGVLAALAAGNCVILKPAPQTVLSARVMANCLWRAGISRSVLQFLPCPEDATGRALVSDPRVGAVILTGAYETAWEFLQWKPSLRLLAETSGKNAMIITAAADLDLAVKDLVRSAFGHGGQKCSAASLAIVEAEVYDHPGFRAQLRDAAAALVVGPAACFNATLTPLIGEPGEALSRALHQLDAGESWLLEPRAIAGNPRLWTPGIKLGVSPQGWFFRTECFGPVLGLVRAHDLAEAIRIQNDTPFGLTGGIHSLDERETALWQEQVEVGNAYINRAITGAIVRRQPFGGWKRSCFGPGAKAGGPNYVAQLGTWENKALPQLRDEPCGAAAELLESLVLLLPEDDALLRAAAGSDAFWRAREFDLEHDPSGLTCETNIFRYRRFHHAILHAAASLTDADLARLLLVARASSTPLEISLAVPRPWLEDLGFTIILESAPDLAERLSFKGFDFIRSPQGATPLKLAALSAGMRWADHPPLWDARHEWPAWLREQAICHTRHRYGMIED